jgi:FkbH-like protein
MTATTPAPARLPGSPPAAALSPADRRRLAHRLALRKADVIDEWYESQFAAELIAKYAIVGVQERSTMLQGYLAPLFELLLAVLRTGEERYRAVYLDERLRYAPHQSGPDVLNGFFREVIVRDEAALLHGFDGDPDRRALVSELVALHAPLTTPPDNQALRLLAVGDCLLNELRVFLPARMRQADVGVDMRCLYFSAVVGRSLATKQVAEFITRTSPHLIAFSFLTYEGLPPYSALLREASQLDDHAVAERVTAIVGTIREFLNTIRELTDAPFLVHNVSGLPLGRWQRYLPLPALPASKRRVVMALNEALRELCANTANTLLIDEYAVACARGYRNCSASVVPRAIAREAAFHTSRFGEYLTEPYQEILRSYRDLQKAKVLLVDFDNTLWDGVMADGPVVHRLDRQRLLRTLKEAGMLLVSLSKNTPENVRWGEMALAPDDFVLHKISWDLKAKSIAAAAQELDLGLDAFVLIDDNPAERELVRLEQPTVRLLDANDEYTWRALERLLAFPNTRTTEEARTRTEMYREQAQRREAQTQALDYPALMRSLELQARFGRATPADLDRVTELVQRTNQFNTTTIRYTRSQLQEMMASADHGVYAADLADKFGKLGLVGVVIVSRKGGVGTFDSIVMSCRAMGFGLEGVMLRAAMDAEPGLATFLGRFVPTDRNTPAAGLFRDYGFRQAEQGLWMLGPDTERPSIPGWITIGPRG